MAAILLERADVRPEFSQQPVGMCSIFNLGSILQEPDVFTPMLCLWGHLGQSHHDFFFRTPEKRQVEQCPCEISGKSAPIALQFLKLRIRGNAVHLLLEEFSSTLNSYPPPPKAGGFIGLCDTVRHWTIQQQRFFLKVS